MYGRWSVGGGVCRCVDGGGCRYARGRGVWEVVCVGA